MLLIEYAIWEPKHFTNTYCFFFFFFQILFPSFPTPIPLQNRFFKTVAFKTYLQTWKIFVKWNCFLLAIASSRLERYCFLFF